MKLTKISHYRRFEKSPISDTRLVLTLIAGAAIIFSVAHHLGKHSTDNWTRENRTPVYESATFAVKE